MPEQLHEADHRNYAFERNTGLRAYHFHRRRSSWLVWFIAPLIAAALAFVGFLMWVAR